MKLRYYQTQDRVYVNLGEYHNPYSGLSATQVADMYQVNEQIPQPTHTPLWFWVHGNDGIKSVAKKVSERTLDKHYAIVDERFVQEDITPAILTFEDVGREWIDGVAEWTNTKYEQYRGMYKLVQETVPAHYDLVDGVEATLVATLETSYVEAPVIEYTVTSSGSWNSRDTKTVDFGPKVTYSEIDRMLQDPLLIHNCPCSLSSQQTYSIVRQYVKEHINSKYAAVTSDYDFCFAVSKRIRIEPYTFKTEIKKANGRSYARPKFNTKHVEYKSVPFFEMTHKGDNYKGYTPIQGFNGSSLRDLAENIKLFLDELMEGINEPLHECDHCNGTGVQKVEKIAINNR